MRIKVDSDKIQNASGDLETFTEHRPLLFGIAQRMLGNAADAEDILQEAFVRWQKASGQEIRSARAFLTTIVTRLCLNHLDRAHVRREQFSTEDASLDLFPSTTLNPADNAALADALEGAFTVMIQCLTPIERAVFLLREVFECDYQDLARIVGRSDENCRQILRRARQRIAGRDTRFDVSSEEQETLLREFLRATEDGDFDGLADALAKNATLVCDGSDLGATPPPPINGAPDICHYLRSQYRELFAPDANLQRTVIEGIPILLTFSGRKLVNALRFVINDGKFQTLHLITCPFRLRVLSAQCLFHNYNHNHDHEL